MLTECSKLSLMLKEELDHVRENVATIVTDTTQMDAHGLSE